MHSVLIVFEQGAAYYGGQHDQKQFVEVLYDVVDAEVAVEVQVGMIIGDMWVEPSGRADKHEEGKSAEDQCEAVSDRVFEPVNQFLAE